MKKRYLYALLFGLPGLFPTFILFQQRRVGNLEPGSDDQLYSEYCTAQAFHSGERTCSGYDGSGKEMLESSLNCTEKNDAFCPPK